MKQSTYTDEFERFWKGFPARWNKDFQGGTWVKRRKHPAFDKWEKLSDEVKSKCLRILKQIKKAEGGTVRDAVTWLNQYGWEDIDEPEEVQHLPESMTNIIKMVPEHRVNVNNERKRQRKGLEL